MKNADTVLSCCLRPLPSEPMLLANLRIYFADFPECTFLYVPEHFMLGDLMRWWVRSAVGIWVFVPSKNEFFGVYFSNNTPGFCFIAHNSQQWQYVGWAAFFNLEPSLRITRKYKGPSPSRAREVDYGEKKAHRGRIDLLPGKCFAFPLKIYNDRVPVLRPTHENW